MKLLVANRGEIAVRIIRAAAELNIPTVAVSPRDDAGSLHTGKTEEAVTLEGTGAAAYLDIEQIIAVAKQSGCDAIHPGYGFLAENANFARRCTEEGLTFIGPREDTLELFGDKTRARIAAKAAGVTVIRGLDHAVSMEEAGAFLDDIGGGRGMMIKAISGSGSRGMRVVTGADELEEAYERCRSEAQAAFGNGDVYVEEFIQRARHLEVQILGDLLRGECSGTRGDTDQQTFFLCQAQGHLVSSFGRNLYNLVGEILLINTGDNSRRHMLQAF